MARRILKTNWNRKQLDDTNENFKELYEGVKDAKDNPVIILKKDSIGTEELKKGSVTNEKLDNKVIKTTNIDDESITNAAIKDNVISICHVNFAEESNNIFNKNTVQKGGYHNYTTGIWESNVNYDTSQKLDVRPGQVIIAKFTRFVCNFDINGEFIKGGFATGNSDVTKTFTIPENVYSIEITCQNVNTSMQQIEKGTSLSKYEEYKIKIDALEVDVDSKFDIKKESIDLDKLSFVETGKNLINIESSDKGYYVNPTTGKLNESSSYIASKFIQTYGEDIALTGIRFYSLYDKVGNYISGETLSEGTIKVIQKDNIHQFIKVSPFPSKEATAQVEYGVKATPVERYYAVFKGVKTEDSVKKVPVINLPSTVYGTVNKELKIFKQNILLDNELDVRWGRGFQGENYYAETFNSSGDRILNIEIFKEGKLLNSKAVTIIVSNKRTSKIKVMLLGDSTVNSATTKPDVESYARLGYHMLQEMGENLELIGTRGLGNSKHEGRGGWTAKDYRSNKTDVNGTNPFYNPATKDFDFSYYINQTSQSVPNVVFIQLGINDLFNYLNDETANNKAKEFVSDIKFIKNNILNFDSNIKVIYNLAIPPTQNVDVFAKVYAENYNMPQWRYKINNYLGAQAVIKNFDDESTIYLNAINKGIDAYEEFFDGVHPNDNGYKSLASQIVDCLNNT